MIAATAVIALISAMIYIAVRRTAVRKTAASMRHSAAVAAAARNSMTVLYGTLTLMCVLSLVLVFALTLSVGKSGQKCRLISNEYNQLLEDL